jgi:hypothetical protein
MAYKKVLAKVTKISFNAGSLRLQNNFIKSCKVFSVNALHGYYETEWLGWIRFWHALCILVFHQAEKFIHKEAVNLQ